MHSRLKLLFFGLLAASGAIAFCFSSWLSPRTQLPRAPSHRPCIAFGTRFFDTDWPEFLRGVREAEGCKFKCDYSWNTESADAVIFHPSDATEKSFHIRRHPRQLWIFFSLESSARIRAVQYLDPMKMCISERFRSLFNWTATYMRSSSVPLTYGLYGLRKVLLPASEKLYSPEQKRKFAFVVISNCESDNQRMARIRSLQQYVPVDVYGKCGTMQMERGESSWRNVSRSYRFYLSFENSLCKDYITEKFYINGLQYEAVPVVFGGTSREEYERVAPPHSFVYALEHRSMRQLTERLRSLAGNEAEYAEYFEWKRTHRSMPQAGSPLCRICRRLHSRTDTEPVSMTTLDDYCDARRNCQMNSPFVL